ncbi:MAG TPA: Hsp20/alpha crystallin family protein [Clostridia bacterium]|nr:Hsp20/alpha crystallin family protein [Clostridia bacterium]
MSIFSLVPYRSSNGMSNYFDEMEKMMDSAFRPVFGGLGGFRTDITDKGDHYLLEAELPGFKKEDIHLNIEGDLLTITAKHEENKEEKDKQYVRRERSCSSYERSFDVSEVKTEEIAANYNNGVLEMTLPKKSPATPVSKQIEIQ